MPEIKIVATSRGLSINGTAWCTAPLTNDLCRALHSGAPVDGDFVVIGRRNDSRFRYFDTLGISILEDLSSQRAKRIAIHFSKQRPKKRPVPFCGEEERTTAEVFEGELVLNNKELRAPLSFSDFPHQGELHFIYGIAIGSAVSAMVVAESRMVRTVSFDFISI